MIQYIKGLFNKFKSAIFLRKLASRIGINKNALRDTVSDRVSESIGFQVTSVFQSMGGFNNQGMFLHFDVNSDELVALSKLESPDMAARETRFLKWQNDIHHSSLTPNHITTFPISSDISCYTTSILYSIENFDDTAVVNLYRKLGEGRESLKEVAIDGVSELSLIEEIIPDTSIKNILRNLVCIFTPAEALKFSENFLRNLGSLLSQHDQTLIKECIDTLCQRIACYSLENYFGLVHGDFKKQNIMQDFTGKYRVIDLQYYTYGLRLWDLAFYFSKDRPFSSFINIVDTMSTEERNIFILMYIFASLLNLKAKRKNDAMETKIIPAIEYIS